MFSKSRLNNLQKKLGVNEKEENVFVTIYGNMVKGKYFDDDNDFQIFISWLDKKTKSERGKGVGLIINEKIIEDNLVEYREAKKDKFPINNGPMIEFDSVIVDFLA